MSRAVDVEGRLARAPVPLEPADLAVRLRSALSTLSHVAAGGLERWELGATRDPRRLARPALAALAGAAAGAGLVMARSRRRGRPGDLSRNGQAPAPR